MYPYDEAFYYSDDMYRQFPPGGGSPFGPPGVPPTGFPGGGIGPSGPQPMGPPPSFTPSKTQVQHGIGIQAIDPGAIRRCLHRFVFIWLDNGRGFWIFPVFVGRRSLAGFRWNGRRWVYFGIDLRRIESFVCF